MRRTTLFKNYLQAPEILMIPVAHDPLCAKILQGTGFNTVGCTGYVNAAATLGGPDRGLLTLHEMVDAIWRMADAVDIPVWTGSGDGYADAVNVQHTVRLFEKAGAVSLMLGDQTAPEHCDRWSDERVIAPEQLVAKIKAAVDARVDQDFTILARTDAIAVHGLANAVERAEMCLEAGADWVFLDAPESQEQLRRIPQLLRAPMLASMAPGGRAAVSPASELQAMGYAAVLWPNAFTLAYAKLAADLAAELMRSGTTAAYHELMTEPDEFDDLVSLPILPRVANDRTSDRGDALVEAA